MPRHLRSTLLIAVLGLLAFAAVLPATAAAAKQKTKVDLALVGGRALGDDHGYIAPGQAMSNTVKIKNKLRSTSPRAYHFEYLTNAAGSKFYDVGDGSVSKIKARKSKSFHNTLHVPKAIANGKWYLVACVGVDPSRYKDTHPANDCAAATLTVARPTVSASLLNPPAAGLTAGTATIKITAAHAVTAHCTLGGVSTACTLTGATLSSLADGSHAFAVTVTDRGGNTANASVNFESDATGPSGGSISYANGLTPVTPNITLDAGTDTHGPVTWQLERQSATLLAGPACDVFGVFGAIGAASQPSPYNDMGVVDGNCYVYRLVATDAVGNQTTYTSANTVQFDTP